MTMRPIDAIDVRLLHKRNFVKQSDSRLIPSGAVFAPGIVDADIPSVVTVAAAGVPNGKVMRVDIRIALPGQSAVIVDAAPPINQIRLSFRPSSRA